MSVAFSAESRADLLRIGDNIREYSQTRAAKITTELVDACLALEDMPLRYPLIPRHETRGIRRRPHGDFLIFYEVVDGAVRIIHILHGAMDFEPILFPET